MQIAAIQALNDDPFSQDMANVKWDKEQKERAAIHVPQEDGVPPPITEEQQLRRRIRQETILSGTSLRDKVLHAFQEHFVPYDSNTTLSAAHNPEEMTDGVVVAQKNLKSTDVDAVNVPSRNQSVSGQLVRNDLIKSWAIRHRSEGPICKSDGDPHVPLNPSQLRAIAMIVSERLSLIQGVSNVVIQCWRCSHQPPGTGKTRVIIEAIKLLKVGISRFDECAC